MLGLVRTFAFVAIVPVLAVATSFVDPNVSKKHFSPNGKYYAKVSADCESVSVFESRKSSPVYTIQHMNNGHRYFVTNDGGTVVAVAWEYTKINLPLSIASDSGAVYDSILGDALTFFRQGRVLRRYSFSDLCAYPESPKKGIRPVGPDIRIWLSHVRLRKDKLELVTRCCRQYRFDVMTGSVISSTIDDFLCVRNTSITVDREYAAHEAWWFGNRSRHFCEDSLHMTAIAGDLGRERVAACCVKSQEELTGGSSDGAGSWLK